MANSFSQLAGPLAASLVLHLGVIWIFSAGGLQFASRQGKNLTLEVTLAGTQQLQPSQAAPAEPSVAPPAAPAPAARPDADGPITEKARFLLAPDLSALENIAVPVSGSLTLRLHVSSLGTVDRVELMKSDPVPAGLLDGLQQKLGQTRLTPALAGSQPVASTLDLVIRYEPAAAALQRAP